MRGVPHSVCILEKVRKHGITALISYIQKRFRKQFAFVDGQGKEIYATGKFFKKIDSSLILQIKNKHWHDSEQNIFVYKVEKNGICLFLVLHPVAKTDVPEVISLLEDTRLALSFYLNTLIEFQTQCSNIENDLMETLFGKKRGKVDEFLPFGHFNLNTDKPYVIQLFHLEKTDDPVLVNNIINDVVKYTDKNKLPALRPIYWQKNLVHIIPALYKNDTFELRKEWPEIKVSEIFRKSAERKYNIKISIGIGQIYSLHELYKSYNEARVALIFRRLIGEVGYVQRFCDLGFFRFLFTQDLELNKNFVMNKLGAIVYYDNQKNGELLNTLRILMDNGFNWKETAAKCDVHVNTIYYRVERIEKMLQTNLHDSSVKFELFVALKLWDILNALDVVDNYYVGSIEKALNKAEASWES
ncbi:PucR family transcriptional regulator [Sporomusa acidovorans]|uniref:PucR C-terminal helix-turn-helix domain-containing protein n=1 Tax=Sporomusa acidovorans (strain ATCC 49682 / DSM 3132 / Mol) TaxID=1123286 RepID=A0ABZ3J0E5_SPOA4|nr:PucR family transcriptional regulator [Sporomusa acidovorans]OZC21398.1 purine catabolism regulatory protein [Sporomusa acidovorans DSM 3132]SDE55288.1 transcriptional regulator, CdaR family [Sporomusa acidovorans]